MLVAIFADEGLSLNRIWQKNYVDLLAIGQSRYLVHSCLTLEAMFLLYTENFPLQIENDFS